MKSSRQRYAVFMRSSYGPTFGGGHDLLISNLASSNKKSYAIPNNTYKSSIGYLAGESYFTPNEVEVFYEVVTT